MNRSFLDTYVSLSSCIVHKTPVGANVTGVVSGTVYGQHMQPIPMAHINITARDILCYCDGTRTVREVLAQVVADSGSTQNESEASEFVNCCITFIEQAVQYGVLELQQEPLVSDIKITGSSHYFVPQHMSVELVEHCNLRCGYCYRNALPAKGPYIPGEQLIQILKDVVQLGLKSIELTGGEPLLHPHFSDILAFCAEHLELVAILTNGTLITEEIARQIGQYRGKVVLQLDLDGSTPSLHDKLRGVKGSFERTVQGVELLSKYNVRFRVAMNITKDNLHDIENTLLLSKNLGVTWFGFSLVLDYGRGKGMDIVYSPEQITYLNNLSHRLYQEHGKFFSTYLDPEESLKRANQERNCGAGYKSVVLDPTGAVRPCLILAKEYLTIGNLLEQSVAEVFSNPIVQRIYEHCSPNKQVCGECEHSLYCRYCSVRGILTQSKRQSLCQWIVSNELQQYIHIPVNTEPFLQDMGCRSCCVSEGI